jgi:L-malate glycosyltransferase
VIEIARDEGIEIHLYTSRGEGFLSGIDGISYHPNYYIRSRFRVLTLFTFFLSQFYLAFQLLKWRGIECKFYINTVLPFSAIWMGKIMRKTVISHVHEFEVSPKILNKFLFWVTRNSADHLITVSKALAQNPSLGQRTPIVISNCVTRDFEARASQNSFPESQFRVLMLASLRAYKGIYEYLELARQIPQISFDLVMSDAQEDVNRWVEDNNLPSNLHVFPVQKDVVPFYQSASLLLNLAHKDKWLETFGMTILEGMCFGLPAIVPTQGGVTELVEDGVNGFLVDYTDLPQIKNLIIQLSSDRILWSKLSQNAFEKANIFSREAFKTKISTIIHH